MDQGLPKRLKSSDGLPVTVGEDNVSQRLERNIDGLVDGGVGNTGADKVDGVNGPDSNIIRDNEAEFNSSTKGNSVSENAMAIVNFTGYGEASARDAIDAGYGGTGLPTAISALDERQLKREKRKQANRESARKSRMRKQSEYEELVSSWDSLKAENESLKSELERLNADFEKVRRENATLMEKLEIAAVAQSNAKGDSTQTSESEKIYDKSDTISRNILSDRSTRENSNSEANIHQLLESGSRTDSLAAR